MAVWKTLGCFGDSGLVTELLDREFLAILAMIDERLCDGFLLRAILDTTESRQLIRSKGTGTYGVQTPSMVLTFFQTVWTLIHGRRLL